MPIVTEVTFISESDGAAQEGCHGFQDKAEKPKKTQKGNKNRCKLCEELGHRIGSPRCRYTPERPKYVNVSLFDILIIDACFSYQP